MPVSIAVGSVRDSDHKAQQKMYRVAVEEELDLRTLFGDPRRWASILSKTLALTEGSCG